MGLKLTVAIPATQVHQLREMVRCAVCQRPVDRIVWGTSSIASSWLLLLAECHGEKEMVRVNLFDIEVLNTYYPRDVVTVFRPKFQECLPLPVVEE